MPKITLVVGLLLLSLQLGSCAAPILEVQHTEFIPSKEQALIKVARDGLYYMKQSRFIEAELEFRRALYLNPKAVNLKLNLAYCLTRQGLYAEASEIYLDLIKHNPNNLDNRLAYAQMLTQSQDYSAAQHEFMTILNLSLDKNDLASAASVSESLSALNFTLGREEDALCFMELRLRFKYDRAGIVQYANLLNSVGRYREAQGSIEDFIRKTGLNQDIELLHQLALSYFAMQNYQQVLRFEQVALDTGLMAQKARFDSDLLSLLARRQLGVVTPENSDSETFKEYVLKKHEDQELLGVTESLYWPSSVLSGVLTLLDEYQSAQG